MTACTVGGVLMGHHSLQERRTEPLPQRIAFAARDGIVGALICPVLFPYMAFSGTTTTRCLYRWAQSRRAGETTPPAFE
jgi:hypothetical protein